MFSDLILESLFFAFGAYDGSINTPWMGPQPYGFITVHRPYGSLCLWHAHARVRRAMKLRTARTARTVRPSTTHEAQEHSRLNRDAAHITYSVLASLIVPTQQSTTVCTWQPPALAFDCAGSGVQPRRRRHVQAHSAAVSVPVLMSSAVRQPLAPPRGLHGWCKDALPIHRTNQHTGADGPNPSPQQRAGQGAPPLHRHCTARARHRWHGRQRGKGLGHRIHHRMRPPPAAPYPPPPSKVHN
jgi:hypothetical protein